MFAEIVSLNFYFNELSALIRRLLFCLNVVLVSSFLNARQVKSDCYSLLQQIKIVFLIYFYELKLIFNCGSLTCSPIVKVFIATVY